MIICVAKWLHGYMVALMEYTPKPADSARLTKGPLSFPRAGDILSLSREIDRAEFPSYLQ
jgi:hypothetical protein